MNKVVEIIQEIRKEWSAPELKKVTIKQITALSTGAPNDDATLGGS